VIRHVLLIPAPGDPGGLLAEPVCGGRPPTAWEWNGDWREDAYSGPALPHEEALVLVWDGAVVPEGCDRACRAWWHKVGAVPSVISFTWTIAEALSLAQRGEAAGLGTAVIEEIP
jgi:hypothetical protein